MAAPPDEAAGPAQLAYELSKQAGAGSPEENWERAERELRGASEGEPWAKTSSGDADSVTES